MRVTLITIAAIAAMIQSYPPAMTAPPPNTAVGQTALSCGNGVVVRADGSVMVDEWKQFDSNPGGPATSRNYPTSITIGKSIKDNVNLCIEFQNGTLCADVAKLRQLLEGLKPAEASKLKQK